MQNHAELACDDGLDCHRALHPAERYRSGQTGHTVNLLAYAFSGSNPLLSTNLQLGRLAKAARLRQIGVVKFASAITTKLEWTEAVEDLTRQVQSQSTDGGTDLAILFAHPQYGPHLAQLVSSVRTVFHARHLVGCTGAGIIGVDREVEQKPAISLLVGQLPGARVEAFHITEDNLEESTGPGFWHFQLEVEPKEKPNFLVLMDPFSVQAIDLVRELSEAYPGAPIDRKSVV